MVQLSQTVSGKLRWVVGVIAFSFVLQALGLGLLLVKLPKMHNAAYRVEELQSHLDSVLLDFFVIHTAKQELTSQPSASAYGEFDRQIVEVIARLEDPALVQVMDDLAADEATGDARSEQIKMTFRTVLERMMAYREAARQVQERRLNGEAGPIHDDLRIAAFALVASLDQESAPEAALVKGVIDSTLRRLSCQTVPYLDTMKQALYPPIQAIQSAAVEEAFARVDGHLTQYFEDCQQIQVLSYEADRDFTMASVNLVELANLIGIERDNIISTMQDDELNLIYSVLVAIIIWGAITMVIMVVVTGRYAERLQRLADNTRMLTAGNLEVTFEDRHRSDEFGALADALERSKKTLIDLNDARLSAELANQSKDRFLATMSHELRTPMNAIIGFSDFLRGGLAGKMDKRQSEYVNFIYESGQQLLELINTILDLSRIEAGKMSINPEDVNIAREIDRSLRLVRDKAKSKGIELQTNVPSGERLLVDRLHFRQMIVNLVDNAIKFSEAGSLIAVSVSSAPNNMLETKIEDRGCGIAESDLELILEPFSQVSDDKLAIVSGEGGAGLGLAIVRGLANANEGSLKIESTVGVGTTARILLPSAPE